MGQVGFRHHCGHRGGNAFVDKFCLDVSVENGAEVIRRRMFGHGGHSRLLARYLGARTSAH